MKGYAELIGVVHFTNITAAGSTPDTDSIFDIGRYDEASIQIDTKTDTNHLSEDYSLKVISNTGTTNIFDEPTTPYKVWSFEAVDVITTKFLTTTPTDIKFRCDSNDGNRVDMDVRLYARG